MVFVIILVVIVGGVLVFLKMRSDPSWMKKLYKDRSTDQRDAIRYFLSEGCLAKKVSDSDYDAIVRRTVDNLNLRQKALDKIGLDEDEIKEIEPLCLEGYRFEKAYAKLGEDKKWRSSKYEVTWIFASDKQLYIYSYMFNTDEDGKRERTEEYFWKDITNFSTMSETQEIGIDWDEKKQEYKSRKNIDTQEFAVVVPGEKFVCAAQQSEVVENAVRAMKAKLREKKSA